MPSLIRPRAKLPQTSCRSPIKDNIPTENQSLGYSGSGVLKKRGKSEKDQNLQEEVLEFMKMARDTESFPTKEELIIGGRLDLVKRIVKQGGWLAFCLNLNDGDEKDQITKKLEEIGVQVPDEKIAVLDKFKDTFLNDDRIIFQNRFDTLKESEAVDSGNSSSLHINGSHQPSSSGRMEGEEDAGIGGILSRLQHVGAIGKESKVHGSGNGDEKEMTMGIIEVHGDGDERSRVVQSSGNDFDHSVGMHGQNEAFSNCDDSMNPLKPDIWRKWSNRKACCSEEAFEAAEIEENSIRNDDTIAESTTGTDKLGTVVITGNKPKDINHIKSSIQYLELELDSVRHLLREQTGVAVPDKIKGSLLKYLDMVSTFCKIMLPVILYKVDERTSFVLPWILNEKDELERRIRWPYRLKIPDFTAFFVKQKASIVAELYILEWGHYFTMECEYWAGCTILALDPSGWILFINADRRRIFYVCIGTRTIHSLTDFPESLREDRSDLLGVGLIGGLRGPPESANHLIVVIGRFHMFATGTDHLVINTLKPNEELNWVTYISDDQPAQWHISSPVVTDSLLLFLSDRCTLQVFTLEGMENSQYRLYTLRSGEFGVSMTHGTSGYLYVYQHYKDDETPKILKVDLDDITVWTSRKLPCDMYMIENCRGYTRGVEKDIGDEVTDDDSDVNEEDGEENDDSDYETEEENSGEDEQQNNLSSSNIKRLKIYEDEGEADALPRKRQKRYTDGIQVNEETADIQLDEESSEVSSQSLIDTEMIIQNACSEEGHTEKTSSSQTDDAAERLLFANCDGHHLARWTTRLDIGSWDHILPCDNCEHEFGWFFNFTKHYWG